MVIDFHTHIFPEKIAAMAIASLEKTSGMTAFGDGTLKGKNGLVNNMQNGGADLSVVLPVATNTKQVRSVNDYIISVKDTPGIIAFGGIHPDFPECKDEIKRIKENGLKGIKIHPDFVRYFADDNQMVYAVKCAAEEGLPVLLHGGVDVSFPEYVHCTPERLLRLSQKVPDAVIICAHLCGYTHWDELKRYMWEFADRNVYFDISTVLSVPKKRGLTEILNLCNPNNILFGTDFPWFDQSEEIKKLEMLNISPEFKEKIKHLNAERLLGI